MTEEIKGIDIKKDLYLCSPLLNKECTKESCYINNGCCCHTVNEKYSQEHLLNYITNLQKENRINNDLIPCFKNREKELKKQINVLQKENEDYKSRNEKAVEYLEHFDSDQICENITGIAKYLLNILQGGDE